ncbi:MAG TPA: hypothetical protein VI075_06105 [Methyloceanibacter sp.]
MSLISWALWIRLQVKGKAGGKEFSSPLTALSDPHNHVPAHVQIETALVLGERDMHDPIVIVRHGHEFGVAPIARGVEQRAEEPADAGEKVEPRAVEPIPEAFVLGI